MASSNSSPSKILLVGNGLYLNRGCEAIVRGSMKIFEHAFHENFAVRCGVMAQPDPVAAQNRTESDSRVSTFSITPASRRGSRKWWESQANKRLGMTFQPHVRDLRQEHNEAVVALEVGGDNYTLDYGRPERFIAMDAYLQDQGVPVVLWGASVGPFDEDHEFAPRMFNHLKSLSAIYVRETVSRDYLANRGVAENVHLTADPAFLMDPVEPAELHDHLVPSDGTLGVNFSPLVGRFRQMHGSFDLAKWTAECVCLIKALDRLGRPILLIPHVESPELGNDDFNFLRDVQAAAAAEMKSPVSLLPNNLRAAELKWIIGRCALFAGARTHSTIAAMSSGVPTLSIGYSRKAQGINKDLFGCLDHCVSIAELTPDLFSQKMFELLENSAMVREVLKRKLPLIRELALSAGKTLRQLCRV